MASFVCLDARFSFRLLVAIKSDHQQVVILVCNGKDEEKTSGGFLACAIFNAVYHPEGSCCLSCSRMFFAAVVPK